MSGAYYNEIDARKAACLREFIKANLIAPGEVDERSIKDVQPAELRGFTQCHFFAGFGIWSYALRLASWPDDRPVWTGSCPCPSFSCAGKGTGFDDPRHLWPAWERLIPERGVPTIFGEQSDEAIGFGWLDLVQTDLERKGYAVAKAVFGACSVGAPHERLRLYFCAHAADARREDTRKHRSGSSPLSARSEQCSGTLLSSHADSGRLQQHDESERTVWQSNSGCESVQCADSDGRHASAKGIQRSGEQRLLAEDCGTSNGKHASYERPEIGAQLHGEHDRPEFADGCESRNVRNSESGGFGIHGGASGNSGHSSREFSLRSQSLSPRLERLSGDVRDWRGPGWLDPHAARSVAEAGATRGFWRDCDWWHGKDGKFRPIGDGLFPLAHGDTNRVLKLRGYGDAIVSEQATAFIRAAMEVL